ncbi:hypothetical protein BDBG_04422 [Blastomyces gilchristii SLH14081]|uniref:Uncharacterized protein n=1 Tax=Blastomyces gilchristii (strain SLH14081) TaxID=559298 RepID=A0A179UKT2_BLAGS|nr:uncharacterized protein BDBG_04422 [Blastomyces gilchristii SLH14081]OAT08480.1 hypothetical protein BDBG_04422 [Blastomyces gilchristii SLH14081]
MKGEEERRREGDEKEVDRKLGPWRWEMALGYRRTFAGFCTRRQPIEQPNDLGSYHHRRPPRQLANPTALMGAKQSNPKLGKPTSPEEVFLFVVVFPDLVEICCFREFTHPLTAVTHHSDDSLYREEPKGVVGGVREST